MSPEPHQALYRILDASINRATEGIRTLEDFARFALDDRLLTSEFKSLRHDLIFAAQQNLARSILIQARNTSADVGTAVQVSAEYQRATTFDVLVAAAARVQQSLRVIEEYGKTLSPSFALQIEQIRYRAYQSCAQLEKLAPSNRRARRLADARLYLLIDAMESEQQFANTIEQLAAAGVDLFQLRDRQLDDRTLFERACIGAQVAKKRDCLFIVNDRADIAVSSDSDGVHVGQEELPASAARLIIGPERLLGISTHCIEQARAAVADGADYLGCGPVFVSQTKQFSEYVGIDFLVEVVNEIRLPAFAIGGIDQQNIPQVIDAGFRRVAVTAAIRDAVDPVSAARELKQRLK